MIQNLNSCKISFVGKLFYKNGYNNVDELALDLIQNAGKKEELKTICNLIDGNYAIIIKSEAVKLGIVDRSRSIPLFYSDENIFFGKDITLNDAIFDCDDLDKIEFIQGSNTCLKTIKQIEAGNFLTIINNQIDSQIYFGHHRQEHYEPKEVLKNEFERLIEKMAQQLRQVADGKELVIPLSGGWDSRFILAMSMKEGIEKVKTYTYGKLDSYEVKTARKIAQTLHVDWIPIEYSSELFSKVDLEQFDSYMLFGFNGVSVPLEQEYFAIDYLKKKNYISDNAVFLPGYCGDVQAGSFIPDRFYEKNWHKNKVSPRQFLEGKYSRGATVLASNELLNDFWEFYSHIEEWVLRERESKYIINGVRAYEFFGFDWYLPLWQKDFVAFWRSCPSIYRRDCALYKEVLNELFFKPMGIAYETKSFDSRFSSNSLSTRLRYLLPVGIKSFAKKVLVPKNEIEVNNLNLFAKQLTDNMGFKTTDDEIVVNQVMGCYLKQLLLKLQKNEQKYIPS